MGDADVNLKKIARLMGHSNVRQTMCSVHPDEGALLEATETASRKSVSQSSRIIPERLREVG